MHVKHSFRRQVRYWEKLVFLHIFLLGIVFAFLVPPFQKPDEQGHFKRAYYLSRGYIFLFNDGNRLPLDKQLDRLITDKMLKSLPNHPERKTSFTGWNRPIFASPEAFKAVPRKEKLMFIWGPVAYIPAAAGILIARILHLNAWLTFYTGRAAIFFFSFAFMVWLYRRTAKPYNCLLLFVFALPMTVHQLTAYSYDSVHYLLGFLIFSLLTGFVGKKSISYRDMTLFGLTAALFMAAKLSYEPLLLTVLAIPWRSVASTKKRYVITITVWLIGIIALYFLLTWPTYISSLTYKGNPPGINPAQQIRFIASHPIGYLVIFVTSTLRLLKFHLQGLIGIFGWLDYSLDVWMYGIYMLAAIWLLYKLEIPRKERLSKWQTALLAAMLFAGYSFIMTVFYLNWKTVGSAQIDGTQGRYFTVFVPFAVYTLLQIKSWIRK